MPVNEKYRPSYDVTHKWLASGRSGSEQEHRWLRGSTSASEMNVPLVTVDTNPSSLLYRASVNCEYHKTQSHFCRINGEEMYGEVLIGDVSSTNHCPVNSLSYHATTCQTDCSAVPRLPCIGYC